MSEYICCIEMGPTTHSVWVFVRLCISIWNRGERLMFYQCLFPFSNPLTKWLFFVFTWLANCTIEFIASCDANDKKRRQCQWSHHTGMPKTSTNVWEYMSVCVKIANIPLKMWQNIFLSLNQSGISRALSFTFYIIVIRNKYTEPWCEFIRNAHACLHAYFYMFALAAAAHDSIHFGTYTQQYGTSPNELVYICL